MNPLLNITDSNIAFDKVTGEDIEDAVKKTISLADNKLDNIFQINHSDRNFENTMIAYDEIIDSLRQMHAVCYLLGFTSPGETIRNVSLQNISVIEKYLNDLQLNKRLYESVVAFSQTKAGKSLGGYKRKFLKDTLDDFHRNGLNLSEKKRNKLKELRDKLTDLGVAFDSNIAAYKDHIIIREEEATGLPEDYKSEHKQEDGTYKIDLTYPSYRPFMKYADSEQLRKELYVKFMNRAADKNLGVLKQILQLRKEVALLLGYKSFAHYQTEDKIAKTPENVYEFEQDLVSNVSQKAQKDKAILLEMKKKHTRRQTAEDIAGWEAPYITEKLLREQYHVDDEQVKQYFPVPAVLDGLFEIHTQIFSIDFKEDSDASVWHSDVKTYNVLKNGRLKGRFYLDLYPRDNKFNHAAMFPLISRRKTDAGYQIPVAALVCNFPKPSKERPGLLPHDEVVTLFHEFGHLMHDLLTESELSSFSGTSVKLDFVETPSQLFENWAWEYDVLKLFAKHYKTGEKIPKELFDNMLSSRYVNSGSDTMQQIFYGLLDLTFHESYDPESNVSTTEIVKELQNTYSAYKYVEGTHFEAGFGHLNGYAAGYYSYLWSKVYSEDIFSVFKQHGVLNSDTGNKYLELILSKGATEEEYETVKKFLGREPNNEAFLKSVGV